MKGKSSGCSSDHGDHPEGKDREHSQREGESPQVAGCQEEPGREFSSVGLSECRAGSSYGQGVQSNGSSIETNTRVCHLSILL